MPAHQLGERRFGAVFSFGAQQLCIGLVVHLPHSSRHLPNRTVKVASGQDACRYRNAGSKFYSADLPVLLPSKTEIEAKIPGFDLKVSHDFYEYPGLFGR